VKWFYEWLRNRWRNEVDAEQRKKNYEQALHMILNTPAGRVVLNEWLDTIYCDVSYVPTGKCCDTAFNEGQRALIHGILQALDRMDNPGKQGETKVEVE